MWKDLKVDSYLRDATGTIWRVAAIDMTDVPAGYSGHLRCKNAAGEWVTIAPKPGGNPVTIMHPEIEGDAVSLLRDQLGATELATQDRQTGRWTCPPWPADHKGSMTEWRSHLNDVHGMYADDVKTFAKLVEAHEAAHAADFPAHAVPHTH